MEVDGLIGLSLGAVEIVRVLCIFIRLNEIVDDDVVDVMMDSYVLVEHYYMLNSYNYLN
jgi:hypothetical protein